MTATPLLVNSKNIKEEKGKERKENGPLAQFRGAINRVGSGSKEVARERVKLQGMNSAS